MPKSNKNNKSIAFSFMNKYDVSVTRYQFKLTQGDLDGHILVINQFQGWSMETKATWAEYRVDRDLSSKGLINAFEGMGFDMNDVVTQFVEAIDKDDYDSVNVLP